MSRSITRRLLVSNLLVLAAFFGLAGAALDRAFRTSGETATRENLQAHVYTLLATADEDGAGRMRLPEVLGAPAFNRPDSGLYAEVHGEGGAYRWRSASLLGRAAALAEPGLGPGVLRFRLARDLAVLEQGIGWEDNSGQQLHYVVAVAMNTGPLQTQQATFRATLWRWLGGAAVLLLLIQLALLRWGLAPLRAMSAALRRIEAGEAEAIEGRVPRELVALSTNLNALIRHNRARQERVRTALADLAHSMKTPLAVLRSAAEQQCDPAQRALLVEQTERIDQIVSYQRQRAAVAGVSAAAPQVALAPVLRRLCAGLDKVHAARGLRCTIDIDDTLSLRADTGDLFELFGNLLENAYKHARSEVRIVATAPDKTRREVCIDDDGGGIAAHEVERLLRRGERADQRHPGEGIGLAVVAEIIAQYGGRLAIEASPLGGARVRATLSAQLAAGN